MSEENEALLVADLSGLSPSLIEAAQELVTLKYTLDSKAKHNPSFVPEDLHGPMSGGEYGPHFGETFFNCIIPFLPHDSAEKERNVMMVPTANTFGCSWRWWPDSILREGEEDTIREHIFSREGIKRSSFSFIVELGLFLPNEGKNRVNFCRAHGIEHIPAQVSKVHYPAAEQIKIYAVTCVGGTDYWAVYEHRFVQKLRHSGYALPLLRAYGVQILNDWPSDFPSIISVLSHENTCTDTTRFHNPVIDIELVQQELDRATESAQLAEQYVPARLLALPIKNKIFILALTFFCCMASYIVSLFSDGALEEITSGLTIVFLGMLIFFILPVLQIKSKCIDRGM